MQIWADSLPNDVSLEQSVATFVDGVYAGRETQSYGGLLDLERVEVLRGPQTTFFGQSAIAGALNIQTRKPDFDSNSGFIEVSHDNDSDSRIQGAYGFALSDNFAVRIAGSVRKFDGWVDNVPGGEKGMMSESSVGRISLAWAPTDEISVNYKYEQSDLKRTIGINQIVNCAPVPSHACALQGSVLPGADTFDAYDDDFASQGSFLSSGDGNSVTVFGRPGFISMDMTALYGTDLGLGLGWWTVPVKRNCRHTS